MGVVERSKTRVREWTGYIFGFRGIEIRTRGGTKRPRGERICIPFVIQMPRFTLLILNEGNAQVSQQGDDVSV